MSTEKSIKEKVLEKLGLSSVKENDTKVDVKFETQTLEGGEVQIEAESFEAGNEVFVIAEEDRVPLPVGEYILEDGRALVIEEEGVIASIGEAQAEEPAEAEVVEEEQEMADDAKPKKVVESVSKEIHFSDDQKNELKDLFKQWYQEFSKEIEVEAENVELSEQVPAGKAIKHSPENKQVKKQIVLAKRSPMGTVDKILSRQLNRK